jgi:glucans biosynthesis protein
VPGTRKFVIDVEGGALKGLTRQSGVKTVVTASRGKLSEIYAYPVVGTDRWRMTFDIGDLGGEPTDLRAYLQRGTEALSETWLYQQFPGGF